MGRPSGVHYQRHWERAGNCALEEVVMALKVRSDYYGRTTGINTKLLVPTSRLVAQLTGIQVARNKAIVGRNAFAHEAGISSRRNAQKSGDLWNYAPEDVGFQKSELGDGKHSGRAALSDRVKVLGFHLDAAQLQTLFEAFKSSLITKRGVWRRHHGLDEGQLHLVTDDEWSLVSFEAHSGTDSVPRVRITLRHGGQEFTEDLSAAMVQSMRHSL